jgi:hypothetical protein
MKIDRQLPRYDFELHMFLLNQHIYPQPPAKGLAGCPVCKGKGIVRGVICNCWEVYVEGGDFSSAPNSLTELAANEWRNEWEL